MITAQQTRIAQGGQIAANRLSGDVKVSGQIPHGGKALLVYAHHERHLPAVEYPIAHHRFRLDHWRHGSVSA